MKYMNISTGTNAVSKSQIAAYYLCFILGLLSILDYFHTTVQIFKLQKISFVALKNSVSFSISIEMH